MRNQPQRGMITGIAIGLVLTAILLVVFCNRVQRPAVSEKPTPAPLKTQQ